MNLPESLTNIGQQSFQNCLIYKGNNDTNGLTIPKSVKTIGVSCFQGTGIENLNILEGSMLEVISDMAFYGCGNLNKINISSSENISRIGKKAFENCINLTCDDDRLIPVNVKVIDDNAFNGCNSIKNVTLPVSEDLKLGNLCFATGTSNTTINIPEELITPPVFTINGKDSVESYPFGLVEQGNENKIPILSIPSNILLKYIQNIYWRKYLGFNNNFISGNVQGGKEEGNDELEKL
jgi:D-ribose pyranose/furanose isomerase RbsD